MAWASSRSYKLNSNSISAEFLAKLACPACKKNLKFEPEKNRLLCLNCSLAFPIVDGIPVLIKTEAEKVK